MQPTKNVGIRRARSADGIPVRIKDNIDTADRWNHGGIVGDAVIALFFTKDAFVVQKVARGWSSYSRQDQSQRVGEHRSSHSSSGWSGRGGQTKNPYASIGPPIPVALAQARAQPQARTLRSAVGTETDALWFPFICDGLVGIKPTPSHQRSGVIPIAIARTRPVRWRVLCVTLQSFSAL